MAFGFVHLTVCICIHNVSFQGFRQSYKKSPFGKRGRISKGKKLISNRTKSALKVLEPRRRRLSGKLHEGPVK